MHSLAPKSSAQKLRQHAEKHRWLAQQVSDKRAALALRCIAAKEAAQASDLEKESHMDTRIIRRTGTHILIRHGNRFAIFERRNNRLYNCHGGKRDGIAADDLASAIEALLDDADWLDEDTARQAFNEVVFQGTELAEKMR